jgi:hypothetical protein
MEFNRFHAWHIICLLCITKKKDDIIRQMSKEDKEERK